MILPRCWLTGLANSKAAISGALQDFKGDVMQPLPGLIGLSSLSVSTLRMDGLCEKGIKSHNVLCVQKMLALLNNAS